MPFTPLPLTPPQQPVVPRASELEVLRQVRNYANQQQPSASISTDRVSPLRPLPTRRFYVPPDEANVQPGRLTDLQMKSLLELAEASKEMRGDPAKLADKFELNPDVTARFLTYYALPTVLGLETDDAADEQAQRRKGPDGRK